jgi:glycine cleavage system H protein
MKCPFLKETRVKFCQISPIKKMIVSDQGESESEKCSTSLWTSCPVAQQRVKGTTVHAQCPFLQESLVQYCSLSSVTKFIPYNEAPFSRCTNTNHRYCEDYLSLEKPDSSSDSSMRSDTENDEDDSGKEYRIDGMRIPHKLKYSHNHMWVDESEDGLCHVGVDAFMTKVLGEIEAVDFITTKGVNRPTAVITVNGIDLEIVFPNELLITGMNTYLRATPEKISSDPYGAGWLFEARETKHPNTNVSLFHGRAALQWMKDETDRMTQFVHNDIQHSIIGDKILMADGGSFVDDLAKHLRREELLKLFHNFFSPYVNWRDKR